MVSDVYQDLFGEGSFIGKGIYDVDSFEQCCADFPENAILSHDLIEGAYCRSGLLSDVMLYEEHPSRYASDIARRHRRYQKIVRTSNTLHAHDERNDAHIGDTVIVREARPLSRTKRWRLVEVLERAK